MCADSHPGRRTEFFVIFKNPPHMSTWAWLCVGDRETSKPLSCSEIGDYEKSDLSLATLSRVASWRRHSHRPWRLVRVPPANSQSSCSWGSSGLERCLSEEPRLSPLWSYHSRLSSERRKGSLAESSSVDRLPWTRGLGWTQTEVNCSLISRPREQPEQTSLLSPASHGLHCTGGKERNFGFSRHSSALA